jgi:transposase-like protein
MKGVPQGRYTKEFREEAVKLVTEEELSLPEAAAKRFDDAVQIKHNNNVHV